MSGHSDATEGPDFGDGVPVAAVPFEGALAGHVGGERVLLCRIDDGFVAVSGTCTHYGAPLSEGRIEHGEVRCPWHHACFSLRTGRAIGAPAFASLQRYRVELADDEVYVREALPEDAGPTGAPPTAGASPQRIVIVGGGAAGFAAAERLRTLGYDGTLTMLSDDTVGPCDRPTSRRITSQERRSPSGCR